MKHARTQRQGLTLALALVTLTLGSAAESARAQLPSTLGGGLCGPAGFERETAASPELVADIEGLAARLSGVYGASVEKTQQLFQEDADLAIAACTSLLGNAHVVGDEKAGYLLVDEEETALGDWRPAVLSVEVTRDGFSLACHFADVGMAGDKVLYAPHRVGLFLGDEERSYLADFGTSGLYVAIDRDGNLVGGPLSVPVGDEGEAPFMTREECTSRGGPDGIGLRFAICFAPGQTRGSCRSCCGNLANACREHSDFESMFAIRANIGDCYTECETLGTTRNVTLFTP